MDPTQIWHNPTLTYSSVTTNTQIHKYKYTNFDGPDPNMTKYDPTLTYSCVTINTQIHKNKYTNFDGPNPYPQKHIYNQKQLLQILSFG